MLGRAGLWLVETAPSLVMAGLLFADKTVTSVVMLGEQVLVLAETGGSAAMPRRTAFSLTETVEPVSILGDSFVDGDCQTCENLGRYHRLAD